MDDGRLLPAEWVSKGAFLKHMVQDPGGRMFTRWCEVRQLALRLRHSFNHVPVVQLLVHPSMRAS